MRRVLASLTGLLVLGCAGPHTSGGLWALDEARLEEEAVYRTPEAQRAALARGAELRAVDDLLAADEERVRGLLTTCPGARRELAEPSPGDQARDAARSKDDPDRRARAARLAQADWYVRRGAAAGDASFCERAAQAMAGASGPAPRSDLLALVEALPVGEVDASRDLANGEVIDGSADPFLAMAAYRAGVVDGVRGPAPLVAHVAVVYGGSLSLPARALKVDFPPEEVVDDVAAALAGSWEPDGLYAALRAVRR